MASIQVDLTEEVSNRFRSELLEFVRDNTVNGVILDVSGLEVLDLDDFNKLRKTLTMVKLMGAMSVLAGIRPGVVASLIDLGAQTDDILATLDLDEAFDLINKGPALEN